MIFHRCIAVALLGAIALPGLAADDKAGAFDMLVARIFVADYDAVATLAREKALWDVDHDKGVVVTQVTPAELDALRAAGYRVEIDVAHTARFNAALARVRAPSAGASGIPGFACYRTVDETYATAAALAAGHPDLAEWIDIGDSWRKANGLGGYDLRVLRLTNETIGGDKPKLFAMTAIHAREYTTAELGTRFAEYLLESYGVDADVTWLLDHHEIHLSLQSNPDGREEAEGGAFWRKNTNENYCGATSSDRGADLNRNFEFQWGCCNGSSGSACSETYRGPTPGSEPETIAIQEYVRSIFADQRGPNLADAAPDDATGVFLDIHSYGELVLWPWGFTATPAPNGTALQTFGRKLAWFNDYEPEQAIGLYPTDGTTDDFGYGELGLAAYTYELGTAFFQDCGTFEATILPDNLDSLLYAARVARAPYRLPAGPDALSVTLSTNSVQTGDPITLTAVADDTRYSANNGTEPTQSVASAAWYLDTPPWSSDPLPSPVPMAATDGVFDSGVENLVASIDTAALSTGRHTIYVQATDDAGNPGPVSATFLYVFDAASAPVVAGTIVAADTGDPLAATVSAGGFTAATDPANGQYSLLLPEGTYEVTVTPADAAYGARTVDGVVAAGGSVAKTDVAVYPFCSVFADDVEDGNVGWGADAPWAITSAQSASPTHSWTDSPGGSYANNRDISLVSPVLDLSAANDVRVAFSHRCATEAGYDFCRFEVSTGSGWQILESWDGNASAFDAVEIDAPMLAGESGARIRFRLTSDFSITDDGWYVDDVAVQAAGPVCVGPDEDSDGVADAGDNCRSAANTDQRDTNGDGFGNACDADIDNDGVVNFGDLALFKSWFLGDFPDADFDGDGLVNFGDLGFMKSVFLQPPGP